MARIVLISDTHGMHDALRVPEGDILIHAGDFTGRGTFRELRAFVEWMAAQPHRHKLATPGNHDTCTDLCHREGSVKSARDSYEAFKRAGIHLLLDSGVTIGGLKFWGSPYQPEFCGWAWQLSRAALAQHWRRIPEDTDILITHGPPFGKGDLAPIGGRVGCQGLLDRVLAIRPALHVFGHIHEGHGMGRLWVDGKREGFWANAAVLDGRYQLTNRPIVVDTEQLSLRKEAA